MGKNSTFPLHSFKVFPYAPMMLHIMKQAWNNTTASGFYINLNFFLRLLRRPVCYSLERFDKERASWEQSEEKNKSKSISKSPSTADRFSRNKKLTAYMNKPVYFSSSTLKIRYLSLIFSPRKNKVHFKIGAGAGIRSFHVPARRRTSRLTIVPKLLAAMQRYIPKWTSGR